VNISDLGVCWCFRRVIAHHKNTVDNIFPMTLTKSGLKKKRFKIVLELANFITS
jgi:hypothetical protein